MKPPRILIIAGSDSGGGAGIQADIKTVTMLGGHAMTAITAVTAQNTLGVDAVHPIPTEIVIAQIDAVVRDIGVDAVKIGMIGNAETAGAVADYFSPLPAREGPGVGIAEGEPTAVPGARFARHPPPTPPLQGGERLPVVFDPVMVSTSGAALADAATIAAFERLMQLATVTTPNLPELDALGGQAKAMAKAQTLLIKGGHAAGDILTDRLIDTTGEIARWSDTRLATTSTHGTGCTLSTAIAVGLAEGMSLADAITRARIFVRLALREAPGLGQGHGPMGHQNVRLDLGLEMRLNQWAIHGTDRPATRAFYELLGLTTIVDSEPNDYLRFEAAGGATLSTYPQGEGVYFECGDLDRQVSRLLDAGIAFDELPADRPWGWRQAWLRDPAGNRICLYQAGENRRYPPWRVA